MEARIGLDISPLKKMSFLSQCSRILRTHSLHNPPPRYTHTTQANSLCIIRNFKVEPSVFITRKEGAQ